MKTSENASDKCPLFSLSPAAAFSSTSNDTLEDRLNINDYIVKNKTATYFIRVKGDSMIGAGIFDEDILVVDKSKIPSSGKIVIAILNGEFTVKRLIIKSNKVFLQPQNPKYKTIEVTKACDFEIFGVVTFNIHKPL
jgi:DNA polymerase V